MGETKKENPVDCYGNPMDPKEYEEQNKLAEEIKILLKREQDLLSELHIATDVIVDACDQYNKEKEPTQK